MYDSGRTEMYFRKCTSGLVDWNYLRRDLSPNNVLYAIYQQVYWPNLIEPEVNIFQQNDRPLVDPGWPLRDLWLNNNV